MPQQQPWLVLIESEHERAVRGLTSDGASSRYRRNAVKRPTLRGMAIDFLRKHIGVPSIFAGSAALEADYVAGVLRLAHGSNLPHVGGILLLELPQPSGCFEHGLLSYGIVLIVVVLLDSSPLSTRIGHHLVGSEL